MKNKIKYDTIEVTRDNDVITVWDTTKPFNKIPDFYYDVERYDSLKVDDDMTIDLASFAYYRSTDFWDILLAFNNMTSTLDLPKSYTTIERLAELKVSKWLDQHLYKGKGLQYVPEVKYVKGIWYLFQRTDQTIDYTQEKLDAIEVYNKRIVEESKHLNQMEEEYENIKGDVSDYGSYQRKILRGKIYDSREIIFNWQNEISKLENTDNAIRGEWIPSTKKEVETVIGLTTMTAFQNTQKGILEQMLKENEIYRYIKFPKISFVNDIMSILNAR